MHTYEKSNAPHPVAVSTFIDSKFGLDGGAMFGIIPQPLWAKTNPPDEKNRIDMTCRLMVIELSDGSYAIVDAGMGSRWSEKLANIYKLEDQNGIGSLEHPIDHVILTHLHFDHAGGLTYKKDGKIIPTFPNAKHYVQSEQWA